MGCGGFEEGSKRDRRRGDIGALWGEGYGGCREAHGTKKRGLTLRARWLLVAMTWQHTEQKKNGVKKEKWRYIKNDDSY